MTSHALYAFWKCYEQLPKHIQHLADKNFALFKKIHDIPRLPQERRCYAAEIGRNYRALARERRGHYYWFWIGTHEDYNKFRL